MTGIVELVRKILAAIHPSESNDPGVQLAWRRAVAFVLSGLVVITAFSFCWAQGWVPGLSGVALASDVSAMRSSISMQQNALSKTLRDTQLILVRNGVKQALKDRCHGLAAQNQAAIDAANNDLDTYTDQYRSLTGRDWRIDDCKVILISDKP